MEKKYGPLFIVVTACILELNASAEQVWNCFDVQVEQLLRNVSASPERLRSLEGARCAVQGTLRSLWPGSTVKLFGSLFTGLGSPTSDLDLTVTLPGEIYPDQEVIRKATAAFQASPHVYQQIHTRSRFPALTLYLVTSDITCDIHFRVKPFEVIESSLLHYLLHIDERALKLAVIVKHWAKLHKLIYRKYLTSYGMMMLVIFFLQQRSVLPSVAQLQKNVPTEILNDTFNVAFEKKNMISSNNETFYEIVGAFFEYYEKFDFDRLVISPYAGHAIDKRSFESLDTVPEALLLYKTNVARNAIKPYNVTALCIQSLLILNDNCAWRVDSTKKFRAKFQEAAKSYRESEKCSFLETIDIKIG